jgi:hypothetical protein
MAGEKGYTKPANKIIVFNPYAKLPTVECKIHTATNCIPGRLAAVYSNADAEVVVNTVNNTPIGWFGFEATNPKYTVGAEMAITDEYEVDAIVAIHNGPGIVFVGHVANGQHIYRGNVLCAAADGELTAATAIVGTIPSGSTSLLSSSSVPTITMAGGLPPQGLPVAIAEAEINASGAAATGCVRSLL